jgi:hypothetical protein
MFYDPAWGQVFELPAVQSAPLRQVKPPDGKLQFVGIHYWFEDAGHQQVTAFQAASLGGAYRLHIRSNVPGFMGIWSVDGQRLQLTPEQLSGYGANTVVPERNYIVSGDYEFSPSSRPTSLFVLFSRSETETVRTAADARNKLDDIASRISKKGLPQLVHETESSRTGQVGHYVVNQTGAVVATEIIVSPNLVKTPPEDFAVRLEFGACTTDVFDMFKGTFRRVIGTKPDALVDVALPPDVRNNIYQAIVDAHFFEYPEEFSPRTTMIVSPAEHYRLLVRSGGVSHEVHWVDNAGASTAEAERLRTLIRRIIRQALELPEVAKLPRAEVGCL